MSEATGRCSLDCGWFEFGADGDLCWRHWDVFGGYEDAGVGTFCPCCGHQLLAEGRTLAPATEEERRDAEAMALLAQNASWILFRSHMKGRWVVVDIVIGWVYGEYIAEGETPTEAILSAAHPQD